MSVKTFWQLTVSAINENSIMSLTREIRGTGGRNVKKTIAIPKNWKSFLRNSDNKTELFQMLAQHLTNSSFLENLSIASANGSEVLSSNPNKYKYGKHLMKKLIRECIYMFLMF